MRHIPGYRYCGKHENYYFNWFSGSSRCEICVDEEQKSYDEKHSVEVVGEKRRCTLCLKFKSIFNYSINKKRVRQQYCDKCVSKMQKREIIIQLEKLIKRIDGQHNSRTKKRPV